MNIDDILNDIDLDIGTTKRMDCPSCKGKNTFTVTNSMGSVLFNCYKASCVVSGTRRVNLTVDQIKKSKQDTVQDKKFVLPEYIVPIKEDRFKNPIGGLTWKEKIWKDYCLNDVKENRAVFLIKESKKGRVVDAIGASTDNRLPKWKRYGRGKHPFVTWSTYKDSLDYSCVLVEDCYSACTVAKHGITGVALLGTSLLEEHKRFLCHNFDTVVVALDPDALQKTLQIRKELQSWVRTAKVLRITDDLKYEKEIDINNLKEMIWN